MEEYRMIERSEEVPGGADYAMIVTGDEMEPTIHMGETVYVSRREPLDEMDVGLFFVNGQVLCRRWCVDYSGALLLICDNPKCTGLTVSFPKGRHDDCVCIGKVINKHKK